MSFPVVNMTREAVHIQFLTMKLIFTIIPIAREGSIIYIDFRNGEMWTESRNPVIKKVFTILYITEFAKFWMNTSKVGQYT